MLKKFIAKIAVKSAADSSDYFHELPLSKGSGLIEMSSTNDENGELWTTKVTAKLLRDAAALHEPCIVCVRLLDCFYIIGTEDVPTSPTVKEGVLTDFTLEYKSKTKPVAIKKVLLISPDGE